uniref:Autophagy-related protein 13 n=1 Tax=Timema genevievae TaxID=629358 RepID=A0A7R9JWJ1_TIMGE|nr:unnamed protein product [Timema genevievae]
MLHTRVFTSELNPAFWSCLLSEFSVVPVSQFNLAVKDLPDVQAEAKKALYGKVVSARVPLCVEISLRTTEGDTMMLETWCLGVYPEQCDPSVRVTYTVYNRMGILLKSLVSVTRVTPAYKLSRRQGPDSYVICYRIYMGEAQLHNLGESFQDYLASISKQPEQDSKQKGCDEGLPGLYGPDEGLPGLYGPDEGEGYKQVRVGQLCTPVGTIHLSVSYRTKMTISPQNTGRDSILVKSDHFHPDLSPRHLRYQQSEENCASLSETIKVGAFADSCHPAENPLDTDLPTVPFSSLLTPRQQSPLQSTPVQPEGNAPEDDGNGNITPRCHSTTDSRRSSVSANDDFIMVDLKTPFAGGNSNSDLGAFYRECQTAPQLKTFSEQPTLAEQVEYISKTLEVLETNVPEYDDMLSSLCITDN